MSYEWVLIISIRLLVMEGLTIEALSVSCAVCVGGKNVLVDNTSSPWHDGNQVFGQVKDGVAEVSSS